MLFCVLLIMAGVVLCFINRGWLCFVCFVDHGWHCSVLGLIAASVVLCLIMAGVVQCWS